MPQGVTIILRKEAVMKSHEESYKKGFLDGQKCGDHMVKTYDINELLEKLRNPKLD